jgi:hypothetical protein
MVPQPWDTEDERVVSELGYEGRKFLIVVANRHSNFDTVGDFSG